ncbi:MAG: hypothetical protein GX310_03385 [Synergistaceae bacterium]|nr:hypothetical protein [Synergistaceae bacterium]
MKFKKVAVFLALIAVLAPGSACPARDLQSLLDERTSSVWYEGEPLGDMIIGARAQFAFIYADGKLAEAAWSDSMAPEWLKTGTGFYGGRETKKKALFIIRVRTIKNLSLDLSMITIGEKQLGPEDLLTNKHLAPLGDLPPGLTADLAVAVPLASVKGKKVRFSVGEYEAELEYPKR